jgi:addiction module HigA family antidote
MARHKALHPGEVLQRDFLEGLGVSQYRLAVDIEVPPRRINEIVRGLRGISADTALRLARYFRTTPQFWLSLQMRYDLEAAEDRVGARIRRIKVRRPGVNS